MMMLERLAHDVRHAARGLRRSPGFSATAVLVLGLGIGANTAVFSVARGVLLRRLPYAEPERLVQFVSHTQTGRSTLASLPKFNTWRTGIRVCEAIAASHGGGPGVMLTSRDRRQHLEALYVSASYFTVFRAPIEQGRPFDATEDAPEGPRVAIVSHALAVREFGVGAPPVGRLLSLGNESYEILGVMAAGFVSIPPADVWLPLQAPAVSFNHTDDLSVVGRLLPGVSVERADEQARHTSTPFRQLFPWAMAPYEEFAAEPLDRLVAGNSRQAMQILAGAVGFVLLIACANVANLFSARASRRTGEIATRAALGASRARLARQMFAECLLLSLAGGALGLAIGYSGIRALVAVSPGGLPPIPDVTPDANVLAFTLLVSAATALGFGLLPALAASRVDAGAAMKDSASRAMAGPPSHRRQSLLVVVEMMLAIVLLAGAGLLLRTLASVASVDRGFEAGEVLTLELPINGTRFERTETVAAFVTETVHRLADVPGAHAAAASYALPLEPAMSLPFTLLDRPLQPASYHGVARWQSISPDYFSVFRIRLVKGRRFTERDGARGEPVALISQAMARKFWQGRDPMGERFLAGKLADAEFDDPPRTIVGVVGDVRDRGPNHDPEPMIYVPIAQTSDRMTARSNRLRALTWAVRTSGEPGSLRPAIEQALEAASGGLPVGRVRTMRQIVRGATAELEFTTILLAVFAGAALVLAAVGLYGLMSYLVQQRIEEIGIRVALGASPGSVRNMILARGARLAAAGVILGLTATAGLSRVMASVVFGAVMWDPLVFAGVAALLSTVALVAVYMPAVTATRVDPMAALRR
jgi:putative ABC transport system permease protein